MSALCQKRTSCSQQRLIGACRYSGCQGEAARESLVSHRNAQSRSRTTERATTCAHVVFPLGNENQKQERGEYKQMNKTGKNIGAAGCKGQNA